MTLAMLAAMLFFWAFPPLPDDRTGALAVGGGAAVVMSVLAYRLQGGAYRRHILEGGETASSAAVVGLAVLGLILFAAIGLVAVLVSMAIGLGGEQ